MPPRNRCAESGCNAACCIGLNIGMSGRQFKQFTRRVPVDHLSENSFQCASALLRGRNANTLVFANEDTISGGKRVSVGISGPCPHVDLKSGNCNDYRHRPTACRELKIGSPRCLKAQQVRGKQ